MSVFSRLILAGLVCASVVSVQTVALAQAKENDGGNTGGRLAHATKCVATFGFGRDCDKDEAISKENHPDKAAEHAAEVTKVSADTGTRAQLFHATKCVGTFGFGAGCDKKTPYGTAENPRQSEAVAPDDSTRGRFMQAAKCVTSFGLRSGCDKGDSH
jgi:hypothetical protein